MDKERLLSNSIWNAGDVCVVCGNPNVQKHHIFCGTANRKVSDKHGYILPLCFEHHTGRNGIHRDREKQMEWMELAQQHYELHKGSREDFIKEFGRSYL